jgi:hypothetical protein
MSFKIESSGSFSQFENFLKKASSASDIMRQLNKYGTEGVSALAKATPVDSAETKNSWGYEIKQSRGLYSIIWTNGHIEDGVPIAIILQYGHGTGTGGYVRGRDYINPAMRPIFDKIADNVWKAVTSA